MNVGRFRELIVIEEPLPDKATVDEYGRRIVPWRRVAMVNAQASDVSGRDFYEAAAHGLEHTVTFTTRWIHRLDASMRILWRGEQYAIDQVNHLGYRRDFVRIKAHHVEPEGVNRFGSV